MDTVAPTPQSAAPTAKSTALPVEPDRISELYRGEIFTEESSQVARDRIHWMCAQCRGDEILDVGCSQGITSILLAREGFRVTAIDTHPESIAFARTEIGRETSVVQARINLLESDLASLPAQPAFDTILLGEVIEHQSIPLRLLREAAMRLRAGGALVITTPFALHPHPDHKISLFPSDLVALARDVGLPLCCLEADGGYIRAVMGSTDKVHSDYGDAEILRLTEKATLRSQTVLFGQLSQRSDQLKKRSEALKVAQRKLADATTAAAEVQTREQDASTKRYRALELRMAEVASERDRAHAALEAQAKQQRASEASAKDALQQAESVRQVLAREHELALGAARASWKTRETELLGQLRLKAEVETDLQRRIREADQGVREQLAVHRQQLLDTTSKFERSARADRDALAKLKSELVTSRHEIARLKMLCERLKERADRLVDRSDRLKEQADALRVAGQTVKASTSFRLGRLMVKGMKSPRGFLALPGGLLSLGRDVLGKRRSVASPAGHQQAPGALGFDGAAVRRPAQKPPANLSSARVDGREDADPNTPHSGSGEQVSRAKVLKRAKTGPASARPPEDSQVGVLDATGMPVAERMSGIAQPGAPKSRPAVRTQPSGATGRAAPKPRGPGPAVAEAPAEDPLAPEMVRPHLERGGVAAVKAYLAGMAGTFKPRELAIACLSLGKSVSKSAGPDTDFALAELALEFDRSELVLRSYFWAAQRTLRIEAAYRAYNEFELLGQRQPSATHAGYVEKLGRSPIAQLGLLSLVAERKAEPIVAVPRRVCYVLHNSLPYSSGGYATRAQGVCGGLREAGYEVVVLTRPGFPLDTKPELTAADVAPQDVVDGIRFVRTLEPQRSTGVPIVPYVRAAADAMEARLREWRPEIVVGASNYRTALPALIAARRLGIPFIYEVRGFWEVTRLSREPEYANTVAFATQSLIESRVAQLSDHVFTLTEPMREELVLRGVPAAKIDLLPNSCDPSRFVPRQRDVALASKLGIPEGVTVIGYVGTFVDYEGLEDLALACANLKAQGQVFRLLLVGNENASGANRGPITGEILRIADAEGLADWLIMPGRVPHEEVEAYYSLIDIAAFPRKPWPVCEMVSPMKPLEALATEKAVLVSSVRALTEIIADGRTGCVFEKGDIASMTDKLAQLIANPGLRRDLGRTGREWVIRERTWTRVGQILAQSIGAFTRKSTAEVAERREPVQRSASKPRWWSKIDASFRERCDYVDVAAFRPGPDVAKLRAVYVEKFGEEAVARRMPATNWARADICARIVKPTESLLDIGSGLGEFVNLIALRKSHGSITSVDRKDYDLWMDASGELQRVYMDLFKLDETHSRDVVTCFEVIEHLPPDKVGQAVQHLRSLAKERLYVSVPFLEPLPLYKGHFTRFDHVNLLELFPDARMTVFGKANDDEVRAWILCEVDTRQRGNERVVGA